MRILVTGAAGFIGSHLSERLSQSGHDVVGLDNFSDYYSMELKKKNARCVEAAGAKVLTLDLVTDPLDDVMDGIEVVYHLAAQPGIAAHVTLESYVRNNIIATDRLVQACIRAEKTPFIVNISTSSVYGYYATVPETAPPEPVSYYGVTKLAAEQLVMAECRRGKIQACSLRLFSVYGPRERPDKLFPKLINCILSDMELPFYQGSELHRRSYTFVGDIIDGLVSVMNQMKACRGEIFNIGNNTDITTGRGIEIVENLMGKKIRKKELPPRQGDQLHTRAEIAKARKVLGYDPKTMPETGMQMQIEWLRG